MRIVFTCIALAFTATLRANDAAIAAVLKSNGAEITETKGDVTGVAFRDCSKFTVEDFAQVRRLSKLKQLNLDGIDMAESDLAALKQQLAKTDVRWTVPKDADKKHIEALFGAGKK